MVNVPQLVFDMYSQCAHTIRVSSNIHGDLADEDLDSFETGHGLVVLADFVVVGDFHNNCIPVDYFDNFQNYLFVVNVWESFQSYTGKEKLDSCTAYAGVVDIAY